jgi:hypothetical protein
MRKTLNLESLEDRSLPSAASTNLVFNYSGLASSTPAPGQAGMLFVGGPAATAQQANGDVLAVGEAATRPPATTTSTASYPTPDLALARFTPDGQLDTGFGNGGEVWTPIEASPVYACWLTVQTDAKVLLTVALAGTSTIEMVRYNDNGSPDTSFAPSGRTVSESTSSWDASWDAGVVSPPVYSTNSAGIGDLSNSVSSPLYDGGSVALSTNLTATGPFVVQPAWTPSVDPGMAGGLSSSGARPTSTSSNGVPGLRGAIPHVSSQGTLLGQIPWSRASDTLLSWTESRPASGSTSVATTVISLDGGDLYLPGGEARPGSRTAVVQAALRWKMGLPSEQYDSLIVPPGTLAAMPPADVSGVNLLATAANTDVQPFDVTNSAMAMVVPGDRSVSTAEGSGVLDEALAAVDAAFSLNGSEGDPTITTALSLAPNTPEEQRPRQRSVSWPIWFVLLAAASGGTAWQRAVRHLPPRKPGVSDDVRS